MNEIKKRFRCETKAVFCGTHLCDDCNELASDCACDALKANAIAAVRRYGVPSNDPTDWQEVAKKAGEARKRSKIPEGWRELEEGEVIKEGDRVWECGNGPWVERYLPGTKYTPGHHHVHIRKVEAEPLPRVERYELKRDDFSGEMICELVTKDGLHKSCTALEVVSLTDFGGREFSRWEHADGSPWVDEVPKVYKSTGTVYSVYSPHDLPALWPAAAVFVMPKEVQG